MGILISRELMKTSLLIAGGLFTAAALPVLAQDSSTLDNKTELPTVTVTADPFADRSPIEATQPVTVLSGEGLARQRGQTIGETLQNQPGVHSADFGLGASRPVIRGQSGPRVRVLDGGLGVIDASTVSPDHNASVEPFRAQQLEVLKGPASLLYGSGAIGGVINVVSDLLPSAPVESLSGSVGARYSSVDEGQTVFGHAEGGNGQWAFHVDGLTRETENYEIPGRAEAAEHDDHEHAKAEEHHEEHGGQASGVVPSSATSTDTFAAGVSFTGERGFIGFGATAYDTVYGVPGHAHAHGDEEHDHDEHTDELPKILRSMVGKDEDEHGEDHHEEAHEDEEVFIDLTQRRYELRGGLDQGVGWLERARGSLVFTQYEHREIETAGAHGDHAQEHDEAEEHADGHDDEHSHMPTTFSNDGVELRLELTHVPLLGGWRGVFGVQAVEQEFAAIGAEAFVPPVDTSNLGLFWVEERETRLGRFSLGARLETVEHRASAANPDRDFELYNLSAGWHTEFGADEHVNLNISHAERAPDVLELYANGPHLATQTIEQGDVNLNKERALNVDLGWSGSRGALHYAFDVFYTRYQDYIFAEELHAHHAEHEDDHHDVDHHDDHDAVKRDRLAKAEHEHDEEHAHEDEHAQDGEGLTPVAYVGEDADFYGFEAEVGYRINPMLDITAFADSVRAERADGSVLPVDGGRGAWSYGARVVRVAQQDRATELEGTTAGYTLLGADLRYSLMTKAGILDLALRGRNLLDEEARNHVSFLKNQAPLSGMNLIFDAELRF
jgi:iron complex outermembrane receptor protein